MNAINVRKFIQENYTPYDGDGSFLAGPTERTKKLWQEVLDLMEHCWQYPNFVPSSGCDIAPIAKWDCVEAFYGAIDEFYKGKGIVSAEG